MSLAVENGLAVIGGQVLRRNIEIEDGKIKKISEEPSECGEKIDASGKIILPGLIDIHVHLREPGLTHKEDITTGTSSALAGGVTSVFEMPNTDPPTTTLERLQEKRSLMEKKSLVNYGVYMGTDSENLEELRKAENIPGVKIYMGSSTGSLLVTDENTIRDAMNSGHKTVIHAEDEDAIKANSEKFKDHNNPDIHSKIRTQEVEASAIARAVSISESPEKLHFTHVSSKKGAELARKAGSTFDVTPHHLFLTEESLKTQGNFAKMNPSLKTGEDCASLWKAVLEDSNACIATDHAGHAREEKLEGYWTAPSGVAGLETMLPLLLNAANEKKISLARIVQLTSENPARIFGVKNKGRIKEGFDADLVLVDMEKEKTVQNRDLFTKCRSSPFSGWKLKGWPFATVVNGRVGFLDGSVKKSQGKEIEFEKAVIK